MLTFEKHEINFFKINFKQDLKTYIKTLRDKIPSQCCYYLRKIFKTYIESTS